MQSQRRRKAAHAGKRFKVWKPAAQATVIVVAVALVYLPALHAGFVWDDEQLITGNPLLRNFAGLAEIWSGGRTADYFPITNTVFWVEHHLFGDNAAGYHAVNILLQATDAVLVWLVLRRLKVPGAWLASLIFGIHPVHAESVAWISELKNVLSMFFVIGSMIRRFANAGMAVWWYAGKVFVPVRLMSIYPKWRFDSPQLLEWLPLIALLSLLAIFWLWRNRGARGAFLALACFVVALLPTLGFVRMAYLRSGTLVADHHQYFADVSLIAFLTAGVASVWGWRQRGAKIATIAIILSLLGAMGTYTYGRAEIYRSEETLWRDNLSKNPDAWQAQIRLGQLFFKQERYAEAVYHCERAVQLKPELADNRNLLGLVYCRLSRFDEGIAEYRKALQLKETKSFTARGNDVATIRTNLANALTMMANNLNHSVSAIPDEAMRRYEEAIHEYEMALELEPQQPAIHRNLGLLLARLGRYDEAAVHLRATLQIVPDEPLARETLDAIESSKR